MIRPLRQRHRAIVCTLGVLLPVVFAAGIAARRPAPVAASLPAELATKATDFGNVVWTRADVWPDQRIITRLRRDANGAIAVDLMSRDPARPDVLVYWTPGKEAASDRLPDNARLLGVLSEHTPLPIPDDVRGKPGRFVLYSLANNEVVTASKPFIVEEK